MLWLERFSPYFTDSSFALTDVRPRACYRYIDPETLDHSKIAYYFDYETPPGIASSDARAVLYDAVGEWRGKWRSDAPPSLTYRSLPGRVEVVDRRTGQEQRTLFEGWRAEVHEACGDSAHSVKRIHQDLLEARVDVTLDQVLVPRRVLPERPDGVRGRQVPRAGSAGEPAVVGLVPTSRTVPQCGAAPLGRPG